MLVLGSVEVEPHGEVNLWNSLLLFGMFQTSWDQKPLENRLQNARSGRWVRWQNKHFPLSNVRHSVPDSVSWNSQYSLAFSPFKTYLASRRCWARSLFWLLCIATATMLYVP